MILCYNKQAHILDILKVDELPFPVLLDHDTAGFGTLVQNAIHDVDFVEDEEMPSGSMDSPTGKTSQTAWAVDPIFLQTQQEDDTLDCLCEEVVIIDGNPVEQLQASWYPHLELRKGTLWWMVTHTQQR